MMEMKVTMFHLLLNFEVVSKQKEDEIKGTAGIFHTAGNEEGLLIEFNPRK